MDQIKKMSKGSSTVEMANLGFLFDLNKDNKLEVRSLDKDSDAARQGIKDGDIITKIDSIKINKKQQLYKFLDDKKPTETISLTVTRNGECLTRQIRLRLILLPTTMYKVMEAVYKKEKMVILVPVLGEFNCADADNIHAIDNLKKLFVPHAFSSLEGSMIEMFGRESNFRLVERNNVENIMSELKLQQSGLISRETQLRLGNMLGATHLLIYNYSFFPQGNKIAYMVSGRLIEVETGEVLATTLVKQETRDPKIVQLIAGLKSERFVHKKDSFEEPAISNYVSRKKNLVIHYDSNTWRISKNKYNEAAEVSFDHQNGDAYAFLINERFYQATLDNIRDHVLKTIKEKGIITESKVISENRVNVYGKPMYYINIEGKFGGYTLSALYYIYAGDAGIVQFISMLPKGLFQEYVKDIISLFNGLQISKKRFTPN